MAHLKKCPHCHAMHRHRRAYLRCKRRYQVETWK